MENNKITDGSKYNLLKLKNVKPKDLQNKEKVDKANDEDEGEGSINQEGKSNNPSCQGNKNH